MLESARPVRRVNGLGEDVWAYLWIRNRLILMARTKWSKGQLTDGGPSVTPELPGCAEWPLFSVWAVSWS